MKTQKYPNLTPWEPGQSGNPAGRRPGSKNMSTIAKELLNQDADIRMLATSSVAEMTRDMPLSYAKAIVLATFNKALQGNVQAITWLTEQQEKSAVREVATQQPIVVSFIKPRDISAVD